MSALLTAARQPLFLVVVVVAIIAGLLIEPWLLPLGIMVYVLSVVLASRDESLRTNALLDQKRQGLTSTTFLARIEEIERSQAAVIRALQKTGGPVAQRLEPTLVPQTQELVDQAYTLARKGQDIERYLAQVNYHHLQDQIREIDMRIQRTSDTYTVGQMESTRKALVEQMDTARVLETYIGRIMSQLDNIDANLDTMPAQFIRMRASDVDANMASSQVAQNLRDLNADMKAFVNMLDTTLDQTGAVAH
jgi:hypothetical protein